MKAAALALAVASCAAAAPAQEAGRELERCARAEDMRALLADSFGEARRFAGLIDGRGVIELFTGDASWTLTLTTQDGTTCLIAAGYAHFLVPPGEPA